MFGVIDSIHEVSGVIDRIYVDDGSGTKACVYINGYIKKSATGGDGFTGDAVKVGNKITAVGIGSVDADELSGGYLHRLRVRDCTEIVVAQVSVNPNNPGDSSSGASSTTTKNADGSTTTTTVNKATGAVTETTKTTSGVTSTTVTDKGGKVTEVKASVITGDGVALKLDGSATVKVIDNAKNFADTNGHLAEDAIDFVTAREMFAGTTETTFTPTPT